MKKGLSCVSAKEGTAVRDGRNATKQLELPRREEKEGTANPALCSHAKEFDRCATIVDMAKRPCTARHLAQERLAEAVEIGRVRLLKR